MQTELARTDSSRWEMVSRLDHADGGVFVRFTASPSSRAARRRAATASETRPGELVSLSVPERDARRGTGAGRPSGNRLDQVSRFVNITLSGTQAELSRNHSVAFVERRRPRGVVLILAGMFVGKWKIALSWSTKKQQVDAAHLSRWASFFACGGC